MKATPTTFPSFRLTRGAFSCLLLCAWVFGANAYADDPKPSAPAQEKKEAAPPSQPPSEPSAADIAEANIIEEDLSDLPVSDAARVRLDRARHAIVQIRGFFGDSQSEAFHGSGFAVGGDGLVVTNYHVVSEAVVFPKQYRLEYLTADGASGKLLVHAIDVAHDLAIVKAEGFAPKPLRLRSAIPSKGERAYSIGFPLNLGLTITEGVANGLVEYTLEQRIHFSGAMNSGMSGGPALDASGAVYGVNVSVVTGKQSVSFVVPAKHIEPLLTRASRPLDGRTSREQVTAQLLAHQAAMFASIPGKLATQSTLGYELPAKLAPSVECKSDGSADPSKPLRIETISCAARIGVFVQRGLEAGDIYFQHRLLDTEKLHPLQFAHAVNRFARVQLLPGSERHVAPYACASEVVALNGFDAQVSTCVRQYRMFAGVHDIAVTVVSLNDARRAVVSHLGLRGVSFPAGMAFVGAYLGAMQWNP